MKFNYDKLGQQILAAREAHMKNTNKKPKSAAVFTVFDAENMTPAGLRSIADWMRKQARALVRDGKLYGPRMTARYRYL